MPKKKPIHLRTVHHNRWLFWAICISLFVAVGLVGYIKVSSINFENEMLSDHVAHASNNWRIYHDLEDRFFISVPNNWAVSEDETAEVSFESKNDQTQKIAVKVFDLDAERLIKSNFRLWQQTEAELDREPGIIFQNGSEKILMARHDNQIYVLRGTGAQFDKISFTFRFQD